MAKRKATTAQQTLDRVDIPATLTEMGERLSCLAEAMTANGNIKGRSKARNRDFNALMDFWVHADLALARQTRNSGRVPPASIGNVESLMADYPKTDPLTMLDRAAKYRLMTRDEAATLKNKFMANASAIVGHGLTPAQVKALYKLVHTYNPTRHMKP
jgi:hypothetical protein